MLNVVVGEPISIEVVDEDWLGVTRTDRNTILLEVQYGRAFLTISQAQKVVDALQKEIGLRPPG
jgi:hypothetical protein